MPDKTESNKNISDLIIQNKEYIYSSIFYISGLFLGSICVKILNNTALSKLIELIFKSTQTTFISVFLNRFFLYFSLYALCVLLGMCLIGFPVLNAVPFFIGTELALKISYFYISYKIKGAVFALLMIIPEGAAVCTVLIYAIKTSTKLSRNIYEITSNKKASINIDIKEYFRQYILYALIITLISLINALVSFFIGSIIKL